MMPAQHSRPLQVAVLGGCGFVGLNILEALLRQGHTVLCLDRAPLPEAAARAFASLPGTLGIRKIDLREPGQLAEALPPGLDGLILGAAITAGPAREAESPEDILAVNLGALPGILRAAREAGVRRIINLSSTAAYGAGAGDAPLTEDEPAHPAQLYGITKLASEMVGNRLADLWALDMLSVRLSAVFGPWEYATGLRDTLSPPFQLIRAAMAGEDAVLARPGVRDWVYAPDVAEAVLLLLRAERPRHRLYNITASTRWPLLLWGQALARLQGGFSCRLAGAAETPNIDLHGSVDRRPLSPSRLADEFGWQARFGLDHSAAHLRDWWCEYGYSLMEAV